MVAAVAGVVLLAAGVAGYVVWHRSTPTRPVSAAPPASTSTTSSPPAPSSPTPSPTLSFADLYAQENDGVIRIETVGCSDGGVGTGFLLSPTLVATVAHVVDQATVISLQTADRRTTGTVIGMDQAADLALVRTAIPLTGHVFALATSTPPVGTRVAAIGFPLGDPITLTQGGISGLDRSIPIDGTTRTGMIETDTPINPGNSGGPLIDPDGHVVGLVDALQTEANGIGYAVPSSQASQAFTTWRAAPQPQPPAACSDARGPSAQATPEISGTGSSAAAVSALASYFAAINSGDYGTAYAILSPRLEGNNSLAAYGNQLTTTFDMDFRVLGVTQAADHVTVGLAFTSLQAPDHGPSGDSCDNWTLDYRMVQDPTGAWRIDGATGRNGSTHSSC